MGEELQAMQRPNPMEPAGDGQKPKRRLLKILSGIKRMSWKKKLLLIILAIGLAAAAQWALGSKGDAGTKVTTTSLVKKDIEDVLSLKAPLEGSESVEVVSRLHYEVLELKVAEGDRVSKGQVLAVLDSEALALQMDKARDAYDMSVYQMKEQLQQRQREYEKTLQNLAAAQRQLDRVKALQAIGAESEESLETAKNNVEDLQRAADSFSVSGGRVVASASETKQLEINRKSLEQAQKDFEESQITSPIDGTVTRVNIKVGRFADDTDESKPMFVIENLDQLQMKVLVSEYDIAKIKLEQPVTVTADILKGAEVQGVVARVSPTGEPKALGSAERVIPIQINITEASNQLIAGITAKARITVDSAKDVWVIPIEAIAENEEGQTQIFKVDADQTLQVIPVTLGVENDLEAAIEGEGLQEGDRIVISPASDLKAGMKVVETHE
jgi:RND family efflux transporter MFP subunit